MGLIRAARCANCGRPNSRDLPDARSEGGRWFCSQSCRLAYESKAGRRSDGGQRRKGGFLRSRTFKWIVAAILVVYGVGVVGALVSGSKKKHVAAKTKPVTPHPAARVVRSRHAPAATRANPSASNRSTPPPAPHVVVANSGFWQYKGELDYGLVLENKSRRSDARNVTVTVREVDTKGRSVATNQTPLTGIPAGGRFVVTDSFQSNVLIRVKRLRTTIRVGHGSTPTLRLPRTAKLKVRDDGFGFLEVTGQVSNPYRRSLTAGAPIFAIVLDKRGRIVGANYPESIGAKVAPGSTVTFDLQDVSGPASARPIAALVSIDPCFDPNQCLLVIG
jgi:hypothetical protein